MEVSGQFHVPATLPPVLPSRADLSTVVTNTNIYGVGNRIRSVDAA
jgi:hypothetical protein